MFPVPVVLTCSKCGRQFFMFTACKSLEDLDAFTKTNSQKCSTCRGIELEAEIGFAKVFVFGYPEIIGITDEINNAKLLREKFLRQLYDAIPCNRSERFYQFADWMLSVHFDAEYWISHKDESIYSMIEREYPAFENHFAEK